jgi:hypothetical protein
MAISKAGTEELGISILDFCRMAEEALVSVEKELVAKGVLIDQSVRNKMGELIIRCRKVTNPTG